MSEIDTSAQARLFLDEADAVRLVHQNEEG